MQAVFTIFGVMLLTFVLFNVVAGDVTMQFVNPKLGKEARVAWKRKNHLDVPLLMNFQRRLVFIDTTGPPEDAATGPATRPAEDPAVKTPPKVGAKAPEDMLKVRDAEGSKAASALVLESIDVADVPGIDATGKVIVSALVQHLGKDTLLRKKDFAGDDPWTIKPKAPSGAAPATPPAGPIAVIVFSLRDGSELTVDLTSLTAPGRTEEIRVAGPDVTAGDLMKMVREHPDNGGRVKVGISRVKWSWPGVFNSQFFWHLRDSVTLQSRSFKTNERLLDIFARRARYSLAISLPVLALGWFTAMVASSLVAYYRGELIDKLGVLICVLGMCIPYLVYMYAGQYLIFEVAPTAAWGLHNRANIYVPVAIAVIAGLGGSVRFYRTVILDQVNQDYVRTARAKGVPLYGVLFRHVLKNCMLPILTALVMSIPFLVMGSLVLERFFGVPGLGGLMLTAISDRDVPIISGLTFLTAAVFVLGLLITDILYAVFDPRIRLR